MRHRSENWVKIAARSEFTMEARAYINGKRYTEISAPLIDRSVITEPLSVGNCATATLQLSVLTDDFIPPGSKVEIRAKIYNKKLKSEWKSFGTFYIDNRDTSYDGLVSLTCYDAMKRTDQPYVADDNYNTLDWPKAMRDVVLDIAQRIGVKLDPRTAIKTANEYQCDFPKDLTMREVLAGIAAVHGGNWIITEDNALRLVPPMGIPNDSCNIVDEMYNSIVTPQGEKLIYAQADKTTYATPVSNAVKITVPQSLKNTYNIVDEDMNNIVTKDGFNLVYSDSERAYEVTGLVNALAVCGELNTGQNLTVSRISMEDTQGNKFTAGDDTGYELNIGAVPYAKAKICNDLLDELYGFTYAPYTATNTIYDPAAETGDQIRIGDKVRSVVYNQVLKFDVGFSSDLTAPASQETESEFPYPGEIAKLHDKTTALKVYAEKEVYEINSKIERLPDDILLEVEQTYATKEGVKASLELKVGKDDNDKIISMINASAQQINLTAGRLVITSGNFQLDGNGKVICKNGEFTGTVQTGKSDAGQTALLGNGSLKLQFNNTDYFQLYAGYWGKLTGGIMKCENYLAVLDPSSNFIFAINTGGNPNGYSEGVLVFQDCYFHESIKIRNTLNLGSANLKCWGNVLECDQLIEARGFNFETAPLSGTSATSLEGLLQHLERRIERLEG